MQQTQKLSAVVTALFLGSVAVAQTAPAPAAPAPTTPPPTAPAMGSTLAANANPITVDGGPLGKIFVGGVVSGLGLLQDKASPADLGGEYDLSNGQVFAQTTKGKIQFYLQGGIYALPSLGTPYIHSDVMTSNTFGALPQGYLKFAPTDSFSIVAGKLPTLLGAESTFTFQNMNIQRGLLWNQEPAVSRGVQANYTKGALALAASWNDGFYSNQLSWISGSITDTLNPRDTVSLIGAGNTIHSNVNTFAAPVTLNNEEIYNLIWTHTQGSWVIQPYVQYTSVPKITSLGLDDSASTTGAAVLASYAFSSKSKLAGVTLPFRVEYISSTGSASSGAPNLLYGQGSNAWSATFTPTFQRGVYFLRAEASYVVAGSTTPGDVFGPAGTDDHQFRVALETGLIF